MPALNSAELFSELPEDAEVVGGVLHRDLQDLHLHIMMFS